MIQHIYKICSKETAEALERFCLLINNSDADVYIALAQKAGCLVRILQKQGLIKKSEIFSSNMLDYMSYSFYGKKVAIIDDVVVSGTTLAIVANKVLSMGVLENDLRIIALAQDDKYSKINFCSEATGKNLLECSFCIDDAKCVEMSYEISKLMAYYGVPYDADFPAYEDIKLTKSQLEELHSSYAWDVYDVSNCDQQKGGITSYTLFPRDDLLLKIWSRIECDLSSCAHLKIRIYEKHFSDGSTSIKAVPMVLIDEVSFDDVDCIFSALCKKINLHVANTSWTYLAKFRFIQYCFSHGMMRVLESALHIDKKCELDSKVVEYQFGTKYDEIISALKEAFSADKNSEHLVIQRKKVKRRENSCEKVYRHQDELTNMEINQALLEPFIKVHEEQELFAREKIRELKPHYKNDITAIKEHVIGLRTGISFHQLIQQIICYDEKYDIKTLVSLFVDRAVDYGIIVPINFINEEQRYMCRAYRHGEDLPFGEADKTRILYFLQCFYKGLQKKDHSTDISSVSLEKLIALFYQMGLKRKNLFNRFLGFNNEPLLRQRLCVHGIVINLEEQDNEHFYVEGKDGFVWVTKWLTEEIKCITKKQDTREKAGVYYSIDLNKLDSAFDATRKGCLSQNICLTIEHLATILVTWYTDPELGSNFRRDSTALTSCADQWVFVSAIMTELYYFTKYVDIDLPSKLNDYYNYGYADFSYETTSQALHSGRNKHKWYRENQAKIVADSVTKLLKNSGFELTWNQIWGDNVGQKPQKGSSIYDFTIEGLGYLYYFSAWYEWLNSGALESLPNNIHKRNLYDNCKIYQEEYHKLCGKTRILNKQLFNDFQEVESKELKGRIDFIQSRLNCVVDRTKILIKEVEKTLSNTAPTYSYLYDSCFIIDIASNEEEPDETNQIFEQLFNALPEDEDKTNLNFIKFGMTDDGYWRYGAFYACGQEEYESEYLLSIYPKVLAGVINKAYKSRTALIPHLPASCVYKHDQRSKIAEHVEEFSGKIVSPIVQHYTDGHLHQVLLVKSAHLSNNYADKLTSLGFTACSKHKNIKTNIVAAEETFIDSFYSDSHQGANICKNSSVAVFNNNNEILGTAVLIHHLGKVYCVTCNHLFCENSSVTGAIFRMAISEHQVSMLPLQTTASDDEPNPDNTTAYDELAIFEANFTLKNAIDLNGIWRAKTWESMPTCPNAIQCSSFGFPSLSGTYVKGITMRGPVSNGFYELDVSDDFSAVKPGFSGAGVFTQDDLLLGIHFYHRNKLIYIIPSDIILKKLNDISKGAEKK